MSIRPADGPGASGPAQRPTAARGRGTLLAAGGRGPLPTGTQPTECVPPAWNHLRAALLVAALALAIRVVCVALATTTPISDFATYHTVASNLLKYGELNFPDPDGPRWAYITPGYPLFLAGVYAVFGREPQAAYFLHAVLGGLSAGLLTWLGARLTGITLVGVLAGLLYASSPTTVVYTFLLASENLALPLLLGVAVCLLYSSCAASRGRGIAAAVIAGFMLGVLLLVRPALVFMAPVFLLVLLLRRKWMQSLLFTFCAMAAASPWAVRNATHGLSPLTLSTHGGYSWYFWLSEHYPDHSPRGLRAVAFKQLDEQARDRQAGAAVRDWIQRHPDVYGRIAATQVARAWGTTSDWWAALYLHPTPAHDQMIVQRELAMQSGPPLPEAGHQYLNHLHGRHSAILMAHRHALAPLLILSVLLALWRCRTYALVVLPAVVYLFGVSGTVFVERYRELSDPLLFIPVAALLADVFTGTSAIGPKRARFLKLSLVAASFAASGVLHYFEIAQRSYDYPRVYVEKPEVSGCSFEPVEFSSDAERHVSFWTHGSHAVTVLPVTNGLGCTVVANSELEGAHYGGIRFFAEEFAAVDLELEFGARRDVREIIVYGYNRDHVLVSQWIWIVRDAALRRGPERLRFAATRDCGYFRAIDSSDVPLASMHVFINVPPNGQAEFTIRNVAVCQDRPNANNSPSPRKGATP